MPLALPGPTVKGLAMLATLLATAIGSAPTGSAAFEEYVLPLSTADDPEGALDAVLARKDRSGVRLFEFRRGRGYRHTWLTNGALEALPALDDRALWAGVDFSPL